MARTLPPLPALRAFEAVARTGSLTAAAADLCVTRSAVSHQLAKLEDWLGTALLERQGRGVALTPAGQGYAAVAMGAFAGLARATAEVRGGGRDRLLVASLPMVAVAWLIPNLHGFWAAHPQVALSVSYARAGEPMPEAADFTLAFGHPADFPGLIAEPLLSGAAAAVCAPSYLDGRDLSRLDRLTPEDLIHDESPAFWRRWLARWRGDPAAATGGTVLADGNLTLSAVLAGEGVGLLRLALLQDHLRSGALLRLFEPVIEADQAYLLLRRPDRPLRGPARRFRDWITALAAANPMHAG